MEWLSIRGKGTWRLTVVLLAGFRAASSGGAIAQIVPRNASASRELVCNVAGAVGSGEWGHAAERLWRVSLVQEESAPSHGSLQGLPSRIDVWGWEGDTLRRELVFDLREPFVSLSWLAHDNYVAAFKQSDHWRGVLRRRDGQKLESWSPQNQGWNLHVSKASRNGEYVGVCADPGREAREYSHESQMLECQAGLIDVKALACSPESDPSIMRVQRPLEGARRTLDVTTTKAT